jgi:protein-disulfide isomerase
MRLTLAALLLPAAALAGCNSNTAASNGATPAPAASAVAAPAGSNWVDTVARTPEGGMRMGNPDAPVKLVEYGSRACPYCAKFDAEGFPALKSGAIAKGTVSYEFREYPVHGSLDLAPILLGKCVDDAIFFPMLDQMMTNQQTLLANVETAQREIAQGLANGTPNQIATAWAEKLGYIDFVKQRGLPEAKARACLADKSGVDAIAKNAAAAEKSYNVAGTPTFLINDKPVAGVNDWAGLKPQLNTAGAGI